MKKFKGFKKEDGTLVKETWFDGYPFGDKVLEGVMFKATIGDSGRMSVAVAPSCADYFSSLNEKKWLKAAIDHAQDNDMFQEREDGGEELELVEDTAPGVRSKASYIRVVKMTGLPGILRGRGHDAGRML